MDTNPYAFAQDGDRGGHYDVLSRAACLLVLRSTFMKTLLALCGLCAAPAFAGPLIDLSVDSSRPAANDMVRATVYSEANGSNPGDLARKVNQEIAEALKQAKAKSGITVKSGQQTTYPVYGQGRRIETWRMRSELILESRDAAAMSELVGQLQQMRLAVGELSQMPSPETRQKVQDEVLKDALQAFQARAALIGQQFGKSWKIKTMSIQQGAQGPMPKVYMARAAMMADAAPAPIEAGESQLTTSISGQIELAD